MPRINCAQSAVRFRAIAVNGEGILIGRHGIIVALKVDEAIADCVQDAGVARLERQNISIESDRLFVLSKALIQVRNSSEQIGVPGFFVQGLAGKFKCLRVIAEPLAQESYEAVSIESIRW